MSNESSSPIRRRTFLAATLGAAIAGGTAACGFGDDEPDANPTDVPDADPDEADEPAAGPMVLRQSMPPVAQLDHHIANTGGSRGHTLQAGLMEGLLVMSADTAEPLPGVAESWTESDDGMVYTFTLRPDARWSNGDPIVADDVAWNWQRLITPDLERPGNPTYNHARAGVAGAAAYQAGQSTNFDEVGVKALDERTVEFTLEFLNPDFVYYLAGPQTMLLHPATVEEFGPDWQLPENWVGNGPFILDTWQPNSMAVLVPNDEYWDAANYHIARWEVRFTDAGDSAEMVSYNADEIDIFRVESDVAAVMTDPSLAEELAVAQTTWTFQCLMRIVSENEAINDIRVRQALSLAINREALSELTQPDIPGYSLVPDGILRYDEVPQATFDPDLARNLLAEAGYANGEGMPTIQLLTFVQVPWVEAVGGMWEENLGVQSAIDQLEIGVWQEERRAPHSADFAGFAYANIGVQPPTLLRAATTTGADWTSVMIPASALREVQALEADESLAPADQSAQIQAIFDANTDPLWAQYLELLSQAQAEPDEGARNDLLVQALTAREESYAAITVLWGAYKYMVKPHVQNLEIQNFSTAFRLNGVEIRE